MTAVPTPAPYPARDSLTLAQAFLPISQPPGARARKPSSQQSLFQKAAMLQRSPPGQGCMSAGVGAGAGDSQWSPCMPANEEAGLTVQTGSPQAHLPDPTRAQAPSPWHSQAAPGVGPSPAPPGPGTVWSLSLPHPLLSTELWTVLSPLYHREKEPTPLISMSPTRCFSNTPGGPRLESPWSVSPRTGKSSQLTEETGGTVLPEAKTKKQLKRRDRERRGTHVCASSAPEGTVRRC